ncbi:uncharacterized protein LOC116026956 [Ipomoea triloba]|uniref:uncharacterized protein LOC116026956 n=1 Tax=Ipomoea triloba TaxID=35885 RepID=UPI00125D6D77|nr:uncharacterized protein LOC116026956 [Ipomoea triloba]
MDEANSDPNCPRIPVTKEEKERLRRPWQHTLIVKVLGRKVSYSYLKQRLQKMWKPESSFDLIAIDQDFYLAKFEAFQDYEFAKYEGPWIIMGHYLTVQQWVPNFFPHKNKLDKLLVWVRFPAVPIEYFDDDFLKKIGKYIGRPIKVDTTTSLVSIGKFARVCVELDLTKPLLSKFTLGGEVIPIEYEGIQMVCFQCGIFGHKKEQCGLVNQETGKETNDPGTEQAQMAESSTNASPNAVRQEPISVRIRKENIGSWMLVARKERRGQQRGGNWNNGLPNAGQNRTQTYNEVDGGLGSNSRFAVFEGLNEVEDNGPNDYRGPRITDLDTRRPLPRIRTNQNNQTKEGQRLAPQNAPPRQYIAQERGAPRGRGGRGSAPRRAAAEPEHTVVRGFNKGKQITTTRIQHPNDLPESSDRMEDDYQLLGEPPDIPKLFVPRPEDQDTTMVDNVGRLDQGFSEGRDRMCP